MHEREDGMEYSKKKKKEREKDDWVHESKWVIRHDNFCKMRDKVGERQSDRDDMFIWGLTHE